MNGTMALNSSTNSTNAAQMTYNGTQLPPSQYSSNRFGNSSFHGMNVQPVNGPYPNRTGVTRMGARNQPQQTGPWMSQEQFQNMQQQQQQQGLGSSNQNQMKSSYTRSPAMTPSSQPQNQSFQTPLSTPFNTPMATPYNYSAPQGRTSQYQQPSYGNKISRNASSHTLPMTNPTFERPSARAYSRPSSASPRIKSSKSLPSASPVFFHRGRILRYDTDV